MLSSSIDSEKENIPLCKYCQKSFANFANLRHHIQIIHLKDNKWDCNKCGKICSSKSNLKVHFRTHIRVKPYTCKHCDYDCMHHSSIKDHLIKNHPNKPHTTIEPGYLFNSQSVPEPAEFNSINFDREKFIESQQQQQQIDNSLIKSKHLCHDTNLSFPFLPLWPFNLYYSTYIPAIMNAVHLSNSIPRKSFEIDEILDLSIHNKKRKRLSTNDDTI